MWPSLRMATISSLIERFLERPVLEVKISDSNEMETLRNELQALQKENDALLFRYRNEVDRSLRLEDFLRRNGVNPREVK